ncbi:hypothetical protein DFH27DRAFT_621047 [Peziza echinospora]|nr:hypothetical protein DFH27DRAFT_621047 [Peziza echinospora]
MDYLAPIVSGLTGKPIQSAAMLIPSTNTILETLASYRHQERSGHPPSKEELLLAVEDVHNRPVVFLIWHALAMHEVGLKEGVEYELPLACAHRGADLRIIPTGPQASQYPTPFLFYVMTRIAEANFSLGLGKDITYNMLSTACHLICCQAPECAPVDWQTWMRAKNLKKATGEWYNPGPNCLSDSKWGRSISLMSSPYPSPAYSTLTATCDHIYHRINHGGTGEAKKNPFLVMGLGESAIKLAREAYAKEHGDGSIAKFASLAKYKRIFNRTFLRLVLLAESKWSTVYGDSKFTLSALCQPIPGARLPALLEAMGLSLQPEDGILDDDSILVPFESRSRNRSGAPSPPRTGGPLPVIPSPPPSSGGLYEPLEDMPSSPPSEDLDCPWVIDSSDGPSPDGLDEPLQEMPSSPPSEDLDGPWVIDSSDGSSPDNLYRLHQDMPSSPPPWEDLDCPWVSDSCSSDSPASDLGWDELPMGDSLEGDLIGDGMTENPTGDDNMDDDPTDNPTGDDNTDDNPMEDDNSDDNSEGDDGSDDNSEGDDNTDDNSMGDGMHDNPIGDNTYDQNLLDDTMVDIDGPNETGMDDGPSDAPMGHEPCSLPQTVRGLWNALTRECRASYRASVASSPEGSSQTFDEFSRSEMGHALIGHILDSYRARYAAHRGTMCGCQDSDSLIAQLGPATPASSRACSPVPAAASTGEAASLAPATDEAASPAPATANAQDSQNGSRPSMDASPAKTPPRPTRAETPVQPAPESVEMNRSSPRTVGAANNARGEGENHSSQTLDTSQQQAYTSPAPAPIRGPTSTITAPTTMSPEDEIAMILISFKEKAVMHDSGITQLQDTTGVSAESFTSVGNEGDHQRRRESTADTIERALSPWTEHEQEMSSVSVQKQHGVTVEVNGVPESSSPATPDPPKNGKRARHWGSTDEEATPQTKRVAFTSQESLQTPTFQNPKTSASFTPINRPNPPTHYATRANVLMESPQTSPAHIDKSAKDHMTPKDIPVTDKTWATPSRNKSIARYKHAVKYGSPLKSEISQSSATKPKQYQLPRETPTQTYPF